MQNSRFIGQQVGNYHIMTEINRGGFGSVYQAKHIILEDIVAIKILHTHLVSIEERERFFQEARTLKRLQHPHVLPIIDAGIDEDSPYLVVEYAAHGSLRDRLRRSPGQALPLIEALDIITQIGEALHYAHQQKIVHRDLKPENILFNSQDKVLLADFGIAVTLLSTATQQITYEGTPAYTAPEQFEGDVSMKSDQYALACITYELLTGQLPFKASQQAPFEILNLQMTTPPRRPSSLNPNIPLYIEQAILKGLEKDRANRYADIAAFLAAIYPPIGGETVRQPPPRPLAKPVSGNIKPAADNNNKKATPSGAKNKPVVLNARKARELREEAQKLTKSKRFEEALSMLERSIRLDPSSADAYKYKGFTLSSLKLYQEALEAYNQALSLQAADAWTVAHKALVLNALKSYAEALESTELSLRLSPKWAIAYREKGDALIHLNRFSEAVAAFDQALHRNPQNAWTIEQKAFALNELGQYTEALTCAEQATQLEQLRPFAFKQQGRALQKLRRYNDALNAYTKAFELDPFDAWATRQKAVVLNILGRSAEALASAEQAIHIDPMDVYAHRQAGVALENMKRYSDALASYQRALVLEPADTWTINRIHFVLTTLKR